MQTHNSGEKLSLINGRIHTQSSTASSITIEHGRITAIDNDNSGHSGKIIDLHGRTVLPAFCDTSLDFFSWSENLERLNLKTITSIKALHNALSTYIQANPNPLRGWYIAQGLNENLHITRDDLDSIIPSKPCAVIDNNNNHVILNTPAMNEFNMPQDNTELEGFIQHLPPLNKDDMIYLIENYSQKLNALGISEIWTDFYFNAHDLWEIFSQYAYNSLTFRMRTNFCFSSMNEMNYFLASGLRTNDGLPFCKMGGIIVNDSLKQEEQKNIITNAYSSGCQLIISNNQFTLNAIEREIKRTRKSSRHLVRTENFSKKLIDNMKLLNLGGIILPNNNNELHNAFQNGIVISAGSGSQLIQPLRNIALMMNNGLSAAEALSVYSWSAAWNGGNEIRRGNLEIGNDADIIVLEQDPFLVKPEEIAGIDITMTICAGQIVYDSGTI